MKSKLIVFILISFSLSLRLLRNPKILKKQIKNYPKFKSTIKKLDANIKKIKEEIDDALEILFKENPSEEKIEEDNLIEPESQIPLFQEEEFLNEEKDIKDNNLNEEKILINPINYQEEKILNENLNEEEKLIPEIKLIENKDEIIEEIPEEIINDLPSDYEEEIENKNEYENKIIEPESFINQDDDDILIPSEEFLKLDNNDLNNLIENNHFIEEITGDIHFNLNEEILKAINDKVDNSVNDKVIENIKEEFNQNNEVLDDIFDKVEKKIDETIEKKIEDKIEDLIDDKIDQKINQKLRSH